MLRFLGGGTGLLLGLEWVSVHGLFVPSVALLPWEGDPPRQDVAYHGCREFVENVLHVGVDELVPPFIEEGLSLG